jgi:hypothetical protein
VPRDCRTSVAGRQYGGCLSWTAALLAACARRSTLCGPRQTLRPCRSLVLRIALIGTPGFCVTSLQTRNGRNMAWEHFRRYEGLLPYQGSHLRYATCDFCATQPAITLIVVLQPTSRVPTQDQVLLQPEICRLTSLFEEPPRTHG